MSRFQSQHLASVSWRSLTVIFSLVGAWCLSSNNIRAQDNPGDQPARAIVAGPQTEGGANTIVEPMPGVDGMPGADAIQGTEETPNVEGSETPSEPAISDRMIRLGIPQPLPFLWDIAVKGGVFMIPIAICSVVVLAFAIERRVGLRKRAIVPRGLLVALQHLNQDHNGIDPRLAYDACQKYRSPMATVLKAAILKVGRPQPELEKAVEDAVRREADQMSDNIRPINVCASISPLIGLLGTVQGMILAFMVISTSTSTGAAKGQELAQGIYTALVTTFAGLCVAIPAIIIANLLEGRIERLLRGMEDVFNEVVPLFERFEGKWRVSRKADASGVLLKNTAMKPEGPAPAKPPASKLPGAEGSASTSDRATPRSAAASVEQA